MASPPPADRSRSLAPFLGALAIAAVALVAIFTISVKNTGEPGGSAGTAVATDKALACPKTYVQTAGDTDGWVPRRPHGLNGDDQLVPDDRTPTHAVVCAYLAGPEPGVSSSVALTGRSVLEGSLAGLVRALSAAPRVGSGAKTACSAVLTQADTRNYLVGLSYGSDGDGRLWVSAPGYHCAGSTNGSFRTGEYLAPPVAASYAARKWVAAK